MSATRSSANDASPPVQRDGSEQRDLLSRRSLALLVASVLAALLLGAPVPNAQLTSESESLQRERSWEAVILDAIATDARFGVDVVYTFGPLADVYIDQYHPAVWRRALLSKLAVLTLLGVLAWLLVMSSVSSLGRRAVACALLTLPASQLSNDLVPDGVFLATAVLSQLVYVRWPTFSTHSISAVVCAYLALAKFSLAPLYLMAVFIPLLAESSHRRIVLRMAIAAGAVPLLWMVTGQHIVDLPTYVTRSAELAREYGRAMAFEYAVMRPQVALVVPLLASIVYFGSLEGVGKTIRQRAGAAVVLALAGFIVFKAGFTRHDAHVWIPFVWVVSIGPALAILTRPHGLAVATYACICGLFSLHVEGTIGAPYAIGVDSAARQLDRIAAAYGSPAETLARAFDTYGAELTRLRATPLFQLASVWKPLDVDALNQIPALLAQERRPTFRPMFQSAAAYSPRLSELNRQYIEGLPVGATMILELWGLDNRYPGLQQSGSWITLLRDFEVVEYSRPFVVLRKRPARDLACRFEYAQGRVGEFLALPPGQRGEVVVASPVMRVTSWGRMREFVLRDPPVSIEIQSEGTTLSQRYVVPMGASGFLLRPLLRSTGDLPQVWLETATQPSMQVRLRTAAFGQTYSPAFEWRLQVCQPSAGTPASCLPNVMCRSANERGDSDPPERRPVVR